MTTETQPIHREPSQPDAVLLVAKSAFAAAPHQDMQRLATLAGQLRGARTVRFAFTEQGTPSLREALGAANVMVETVRGAGYRITAQPQALQRA